LHPTSTAPAAAPPSPPAPVEASAVHAKGAPAAEPAAAKAGPRTAGAASAGIVRVDTLKLDSLIDLVGELVIAQSMVVQNTEVGMLSDSLLSRSISQLRGITSDLQRTAMSLRMVPIRATFQKMTRLVRDLAVQQGKDIRLVLQGEDTELDRTLVEELNDPLIHMIRNSADHGIEPAEERIAKGKPAFGTITLRAFHQGGFIVIEIQDDGRGLNPDRIRQKAIERGLIRADDDLDKDSILELIFTPGFSTAEQITDLSGRGVGMDVVRRNIEKMRGQIEIHSDVGAGTTFTIYMPLTLAIIEGLLVGVGDQHRSQAEPLRRADDPQRNLAAVGHQEGVEREPAHGLSPVAGWTSPWRIRDRRLSAVRSTSRLRPLAAAQARCSTEPKITSRTSRTSMSARTWPPATAASMRRVRMDV
jgi:two-component system chemotaxis sensor kinase CheA